MIRHNSLVWWDVGQRSFTRELAVVVALLLILVVAPAFLSEFRLNQLGKFLTFAIVVNSAAVRCGVLPTPLVA